MARRIVIEVTLIVVLTVLLAWMLLGAFALTDSVDPLGTLVDQTPRVLFGLLGIGLTIWVVLLIIGAIVHRRRAVGWRVATHLTSLLVALGINIGVFAVITAIAGPGGGEDWGALVVAIAAAAGAVLFAAGLVVVLVVELLILPNVPSAPSSRAEDSQPR